MHVAITGATGLIGTPLVARLRADGHTVTRIVRKAAEHGDRVWDPTASALDPSLVDGIDSVVHLAGAGIGDHRWTPAYKDLIRTSRTHSTELLSKAIAQSSSGPKVLLSGSAIGIYGDRGDEALDESSSLGHGYLADVCRDWEHATVAAESAGVRVAHLRTGIVLTPAGGALKKLLPLFRLGLGGRFGNGRQWQSWISIDDEVSAISSLLTSDVRGAVNLTAPNPVTNTEFTRVLGRVLQRPALFPVPAFGPRLVVGRELADNLLFTGQRVAPMALTNSGFHFQHATLEPALRHLLRRG